jgi:ribosomal protein S3AE
MLTIELKSLVVSVIPLVVDSFDKEEIIKLLKEIVEYKLSSSIIVDFIRRVIRKVIKNLVKTASA